MTPLRQRMLDAMVQRGFALRTRESYVEAVARMAKYFHRDPATLAAEEVQAYLLYLRQDRHLSFSIVNQAASANRFLYEVVLGHERSRFLIPQAKAPQRQPQVLARVERRPRKRTDGGVARVRQRLQQKLKRELKSARNSGGQPRGLRG